MPQGVQALLALLVLLPGFVSARIARAVVGPATPNQTELERVIQALIFSFFTYVLYLLVFGETLPVQWTAVIDAAHVEHYSVHVFRWRLVFLTLVAVALGFFWGVIQQSDVPLHWLRRFGLTDRTNDISVWAGTFRDLGGTVQVGFSDGRSILGWLRRYSDRGEERSLFLERAAWVGEDGQLTEVAGEGILITDKAEIKYVMFLNSDLNESASEVLH